jgi:hypothetical protein
MKFRFFPLYAEADGTPQGGGGAPAPDPTPWHASIFTGEGAFVDGWQSKLPDAMEPYRGTLANFKDMPTLAKALHDNMAAARSKGGLQALAPDATPEQQAAFDAELRRLGGVPADAAGYEFKAPDTLPAGVEWNAELATKFAADAHRLGLTPAQAEGILSMHTERLGAAVAEQTAQLEAYRKAEAETLTKLFGAKLDESLAKAARAATTLNVPGAAALMDPKNPLYVGADVVAAFVKMADHLGEKRMVSGAAVTNLDAGTMADDIMTNASNPDYAAYRNSSHPQHAATVQKVNQLRRQQLAGAEAR